MTAFEEALAAVMAARIERARGAMSTHARIAISDPDEARRALGDVHMILSQLAEDVRCLQQLHEMTEEIATEREPSCPTQ